MGITVKYSLITTHTKDIGKSLKKESYNEIAKGFKQEIEKQLKGVQCDNCKGQTRGTITVKATLNGLQFTKTGFCCDDFNRSIELPKS